MISSLVISIAVGNAVGGVSSGVVIYVIISVVVSIIIWYWYNGSIGISCYMELVVSVIDWLYPESITIYISIILAINKRCWL